MISLADLKREHRAIMSLMASMSVPEGATPRDAERVRHRAHVLAARVHEHFAQEDRLLTHACAGSGAPEDRLAMTIRMREAGNLAESCASFAAHWGGPGCIERDPDSYQAGLAMLERALDRLVRREEDRIYPLAADAADAPLAIPPGTGMADVDEDHARIFAMIGGLRAASGGGRTIVDGGLVAQLVDYAERHFAREEAIMDATTYPGLEDHRHEHHRARRIVMGFRNDHLDGRQVEAHAILGFLERWLVTHIAHTDQAMAAHVRGNAPPHPAP